MFKFNELWEVNSVTPLGEEYDQVSPHRNLGIEERMLIKTLSKKY